MEEVHEHSENEEDREVKEEERDEELAEFMEITGAVRRKREITGGFTDLRDIVEIEKLNENELRIYILQMEATIEIGSSFREQERKFENAVSSRWTTIVKKYLHRRELRKDAETLRMLKKDQEDPASLEAKKQEYRDKFLPKYVMLMRSNPQLTEDEAKREIRRQVTARMSKEDKQKIADRFRTAKSRQVQSVQLHCPAHPATLSGKE